MKIRDIIICFVIGLTILTCGKKMPLPSVEVSIESFGANDTSYIHVTPVWDDGAIGYSQLQPMTPVDLAIGEDGYIFIADSANNRIATLSQSGFVVTLGNMDKIEPVQSPSGIDIDVKLNLLIVNGTNVVYAWNQYLNYEDVDSVMLVFPDSSYIMSGVQADIDSVRGITPFYIDEDEDAQFHDVAFGPKDDNTVFLTDKGKNRIVQLKIVMNGAAKLSNGYYGFTYMGMYDGDVATYGSGAGTVDNPRGIIADDDGNIYFVQLGGNFYFQKLKKQNMRYVSEYTLYDDPIMDLNRFGGPHNIALDGNDNIFVLDTAVGEVYKFFNKGTKAGTEANLGKIGLVEAMFVGAQGIVVSESGLVYIADTKNNRIVRYQFSVSESDIPVIEP